MNYSFQTATAGDIDEIIQMVFKAVVHMEKAQIHQWDELYPDRGILLEDIQKQQLVKVVTENTIVAVYVLNSECDPAYENGDWRSREDAFLIVHRLCVNPDFQHRGIARMVMKHIEKDGIQKGFDCIRLDSFPQNPYAMKLYQGEGYRVTGYVDWRKGRFALMEKIIG